MRRGNWRIAIDMLCSGMLVLGISGCDRSYQPSGRGDAELKAEDAAARRAAQNQAAHILVKVDDETVDQRLDRLEQDVETLKASLNKEQTDLELLKARNASPSAPAHVDAPPSPHIVPRLPQPVGPD
jgi:hypothetical protein